MRVRIAIAMTTTLSLAWACESFSSVDDDAPPDASTSDAPSGESSVDADADADAADTEVDGSAVKDAAVDVGEFDLEIRQECPRPAAGTPCTGVGIGNKECVANKLFDPPVAEHVFGIVADRRHVFWLSQPFVPDGGGNAYNGLGIGILRRLERATGKVVELARGQVHGRELFAHGPNLFWGVEDPAGSGNFGLRTLRKDAPACTVSSCSQTTKLAADLGGRVTQMGALTPDRVFVVTASGNLYLVTIDPPSKLLIGATTTFPAFTVGEGYAYLGGGFQTGVERYGATGAQAPNLGAIPDASLGGLYLATTCAKVYSRGDDNRVLVIDAGAEGGAFVARTSLGAGFPVYSNASDERFLYYGAANAFGLRRVDTTVQDAAPVEIAIGSVWGIAVTDDAIFYGTHGELGSTANSDIGSIFSIAK